MKSNLEHQPLPNKPPLVVIIGPTASGKSALSMEIAKRYSGEIICADSRTVYKGMDIGTAKPTPQDQQAIPHHLLDVVEPDQVFTAADFKRLANEAINKIAGRGSLPIMVGGSGLYIDAVLFDYGFSGSGAKRDSSNPRHLDVSVPKVKEPMRENTLVVGLNIPRPILRDRIEQRIDAMAEAGFVSEVEKLLDQHPDSKALLAPGYKAFAGYLKGSLDLEEAKAIFAKNDFQLAKRQMTWFRRNKSIHWVDNSSAALATVSGFVNKTT